MYANNKDAARKTGSSVKETRSAWHQARDDATQSGELNERAQNKVSDSPEGGILYKIFKAAGLVRRDND